MAVIKTMITIDEDLLKKVDDYCNENYLSRSGFFSFVGNEYLKQKKIDNAILSLSRNVSLYQSDEGSDIEKIRNDLNNILKYIENV